MKTVLFSLFLFLAFAVVLSPQAFASHNPHGNDQIPEKNGAYDDPDHPGIKVRVFVHPEKPERVSATALVCGLADSDSASTVHATNWHLPATVTYNLNPSSVPSSVSGTNLATIAANGFADWVLAAGNTVTFTQGATTTVARTAYDGKNIIAWGRTSGSALGVTYVRYYTSTGLVVDVDTIMNKKFPWKWNNSSVCADPAAYDAENILTHELGHWLGLNDEYDTILYGNATMYGYGSRGEVKKNTLTVGDNAGAYNIYN